MSGRLPPLSTLRAFEAVARLGSVSRAAEALGRTHGAVSKQLRSLGDHAGVAFFEKVGTGLRPTPASARFAAAVGQAFEALSVAYDSVAPRARAPQVHVACSVTFATRWLAPRLASFAAAHPDIRVRMEMTSAREMRQETDADLLVLWDWQSYPQEDRARAVRLGEACFVAVAAPGLPVAVDEAGGLSAPCRIDHEHTSRAWSLWQAQGRSLATASVMAFPHSHLCIEAAVAGLGVALVEQRLVARELADGLLVALGEPMRLAEGFVAIPHGARAMTPPAGRFLDWLAAELGAPPSIA
ncbi:MAG: LysR family transcriptional regulator [Phenylobacterium zucineum]|nr:MAG: LysR family transcriptional regulator [Phenylobacterium zucineum]